MGKASRLKAERQQVKVIREPVTVTHEPDVPNNWPDGHVGVASRIDEWNVTARAAGVPEV